jgi:MoaA/NifB/PqqE/SkfB family radical SAM enzyme
MTLILEINGRWSCNFRCGSCTLRNYTPSEIEKKIENSVNYGSLAPIIKEYKNKYPDGIIQLQGGEPLLYFDKFLSIASSIKKEYPDTIIGTISNCSVFSRPENIEKFKLSGVSFITCSLNSHIPEIHNKSRGVSDDNCSLILQLPEKLHPVKCSISTVVDENTVPHMKDMIKVLKDKGFEEINLCFFKSNNPVERLKLLSFYRWLLFKAPIEDRKFVRNPDWAVEGMIRWLKNEPILLTTHCSAVGNTIYVAYDKKIKHCCHSQIEKFSRTLRWSPGAIEDPLSEFNQQGKTLSLFCYKECMYDPCYY